MPVAVELGRARGHPVGQLALRFLVAGKLEPRILQILDVDREARHRAGRQAARRPGAAPAAPGRSWRAGCANRAVPFPARSRRPSERSRSRPLRSARCPARSRRPRPAPSTAATNAALTRPRLRSGPRYHIGKGALSISWVSASSAPSVCWSRRASLARSASASLMSNSQTSTVPGFAGGGARAARSLDDPVPSSHSELAADRRTAQPDFGKVGRQRIKVLALESRIDRRPGRQAVRGAAGKPKSRTILRVGLHLAVGMNQQGPRRRRIQQRPHGPRGAQHRLRAAHAAWPRGSPAPPRSPPRWRQ